jgi:hypothetical protein
MNNSYYLYRLFPENDCEAEIFGKFSTLSEAKLSAKLLLINYSSFILSGDMTKIYFYDDKNGWDYDILTESGKTEFLEMYPDPSKYI